MRFFIVLSIIMVAWVIIAPSCMQFRISDSKAKEDFTKLGIDLQVRDLKVNGRKLHYVQTGLDTLPTLLFVHGSPGSWNAFQSYLGDSLLLQKYRMVSVDRPGFGYSDFGQAMHLDAQTSMMMPLIEQLRNGKPIYLVGHSLGGPLVVMLASRAPEWIQGIVVIAGSVDPAEEAPERWRNVLDKTPLYYFVPGAFRPSNRELAYFKRDVNLLVSDFEKVTCKVYLVHGDKDTFVPPGNVAYAQSQLKNAAKVDALMFPGANHFIPWTRYDQIRNLLLNL